MKTKGAEEETGEGGGGGGARETSTTCVSCMAVIFKKMCSADFIQTIKQQIPRSNLSQEFFPPV